MRKKAKSCKFGRTGGRCRTRRCKYGIITSGARKGLCRLAIPGRVKGGCKYGKTKASGVWRCRKTSKRKARR